MFTSDFLRFATVGWLAEKQKLYPLRDERLATAIEQDLCDPIPPTPAETYVVKAKECARQAVVSHLRNLAFTHRPPFHYVGIEGRASLPEKLRDRPAQGQANACRDGGFSGRRVQIINHERR
jgi:hypothetical protein